MMESGPVDPMIEQWAVDSMRQGAAENAGTFTASTRSDRTGQTGHDVMADD